MGRLDPKFVLKEASSNKETLIYLVMWSNYKRMKIYIGEKIEPCFWDTSSQRPTANKSILRKLSPIVLKRLNYLSIRLDEIDLFVQNLIIDLKRDNQLSLDNIKSKLDIYFGRVKEPISKIFAIDYFIEIYQRMDSGDLLTDRGLIYTKGTLKTYKSTIAKLREYESNTCMKLKFEDINKNFYDSYLQYCNDKQYKPNTIAKSLGTIKSFMNIALREGAHNNTFQNSSEFRINKEKVDNIYLNIEELDKLYNLKLENKALETIRDVFLIGCYTALRYSDYSRIKAENIRTTASGIKVIDITTQKTNQRVIIPFLFDKLEPLLKKYDYNVPKTLEQKVNKYIKIIGEKAGINTPIITTETRGGKRFEEKHQKWELITTHTARRSGATNMHKMGHPDTEIMKITGHTTIVSFLNYIKLSKEENAELMIERMKKYPIQ